MHAYSMEKAEPAMEDKTDVSIEEADDSFKFLNCTCLEVASDWIISKVEAAFYHFGRFTGRYPWVCIIVGAFIPLICLVGIINFYEQLDRAKLWVPQSSRAVEDNDLSQEWFPSLVRRSTIVFTADDVLVPEVIQAALSMDTEIKSIVTFGKTYEELCFQVGEGLCKQDSLLEVWSYNATTIDALTEAQIESDVNSITTSPVTNGPYTVTRFLGGEKEEQQPDITEAKAFLMSYYMKTRSGTQGSKSDLEFEQQFLDICRRGVDTSGISVYCGTPRSFDDVSGDATSGDVTFLIIGYNLVIIFLMLTLGYFNRLHNKVVISLAGILCVGLSIAFSFGFCSGVGLDYTQVHSVLPFLLLGVGVDDVFVFVAAWDNLTPEETLLPVREKIALTYRHAGVSILVTSLTDAVAFLIGASTAIPALSSFCFYAAVGIIGLFTSTLTVFAGFFTYDQLRVAAKRDAIFCCITLKPDYKPNEYCTVRQPIASNVFDKYVAKFLSFLPVKIVVFVITISIFGVGAYGVSVWKADFDPLRWFIPDGNYYDRYLEVTDKYFLDYGNAAYIYLGEIDYYDTEIRDAILDLPDRIEDAFKVTPDSADSWYTAYYNWLTTTSDSSVTSLLDGDWPSSNANFITTVLAFLDSDDGVSYETSVNFNDDETVITSSRIAYQYESMDNSEDRIKAMDESREAVDDGMPSGVSEREAFCYDQQMLGWEGQKVILQELFTNILLAFVAVFVVCMFLIANIVVVLLVLSCVVFTLFLAPVSSLGVFILITEPRTPPPSFCSYEQGTLAMLGLIRQLGFLTSLESPIEVDVGGMLHFWGVTVNTVSTINLILAIGLTVDYAAHIGHAFMIATGSRQSRMQASLKEIGAAVFFGGFSTFLAFLPLCGSISYIFFTFFQVFLLVSIFGLFHGLIYLPVMLTWLGPSPYRSALNKHQESSSGGAVLTANNPLNESNGAKALSQVSPEAKSDQVTLNEKEKPAA